MNILHVIPSYVPAFRYGGPMRSVHGLACAQAAAGDRVVVMTTDADGPARLDVPLGRPVPVDGHQAWYFRTGFPRRLARAPGLIGALAAELPSFDVVHLHSVFLWPTLVAARAARRARRPYVVSPRGMLVSDLIRRRGALRKRLWIALCERRTLAESARIVVSSPLEATEIARLGLDLAPLREVPNGIDPEVLAVPDAALVSAPVAAAVAGGPYALFLGRLSWKKGIDLLLRAAAQTTMRVLIAGPDDEGLRPRLEALAHELEQSARVAFLGEVRGADRSALLHSARVLVLVSASENFANAVLEAMACGVPVILSPAVGLAPEVERRAAGWVIPADEQHLAAALRRCLEHPDLARAAGEHGRQAVAATYSWAAVASRMSAVYHEAIEA